MLLMLSKKILLGLFLLTCVSLTANDDPFEEINRSIWNFNEALDDNFAKPVAEVYDSIHQLLFKPVLLIFLGILMKLTIPSISFFKANQF